MHGPPRYARPAYEASLAAELRQRCMPAEIRALRELRHGQRLPRRVMRRVSLRALRAAAGRRRRRRAGVGFRHLETFEIGDGVFIGAQAILQGRFDGPASSATGLDRPAELSRRPRPGDRRHVGWGPGAKVLGLGAHRRAARRADHPDRPRDQARAHRGVGRHRRQRGHPARRHRRPRQHRRRRRGGDQRRAAVRQGRRRAGARDRLARALAEAGRKERAMDMLNLAASASWSPAAPASSARTSSICCCAEGCGEIIVLDNMSRGRPREPRPRARPRPGPPRRGRHPRPRR